MGDSATIFARCTPDERKWLEAAAKVEGFRSFSEWIRQTLFQRASRILGELPPA